MKHVHYIFECLHQSTWAWIQFFTAKWSCNMLCILVAIMPKAVSVSQYVTWRPTFVAKRMTVTIKLVIPAFHSDKGWSFIAKSWIWSMHSCFDHPSRNKFPIFYHWDTILKALSTTQIILKSQNVLKNVVFKMSKFIWNTRWCLKHLVSYVCRHHILRIKSCIWNILKMDRDRFTYYH